MITLLGCKWHASLRPPRIPSLSKFVLSHLPLNLFKSCHLLLWSVVFSAIIDIVSFALEFRCDACGSGLARHIEEPFFSWEELINLSLLLGLNWVHLIWVATSLKYEVLYLLESLLPGLLEIWAEAVIKCLACACCSWWWKPLMIMHMLFYSQRVSRLLTLRGWYSISLLLFASSFRTWN